MDRRGHIFPGGTTSTRPDDQQGHRTPMCGTAGGGYGRNLGVAWDDDGRETGSTQFTAHRRSTPTNATISVVTPPPAPEVRRAMLWMIAPGNGGGGPLC